MGIEDRRTTAAHQDRPRLSQGKHALDAHRTSTVQLDAVGVSGAGGIGRGVDLSEDFMNVGDFTPLTDTPTAGGPRADSASSRASRMIAVGVDGAKPVVVVHNGRSRTGESVEKNIEQQILVLTPVIQPGTDEFILEGQLQTFRQPPVQQHPGIGPVHAGDPLGRTRRPGNGRPRR